MTSVNEGREQLARVMDDLGLSLDFEFVPQQFADGTKLTDMGRKWKVTVRYHGTAVLATTYTQGVAYCPSYKQSMIGGVTVHDYATIRRECYERPREGQPKDPMDALWCIAQDCQGVNNSSGFEEWATELGYDPDSRKAEGIYRECQKQWTTLRSYIGDAGIDALANVEL